MGYPPSLREAANFPQAIDAYFKGLEQDEDDLHVVLLSNMEDGVWQPIRKVHELLMAAR